MLKKFLTGILLVMTLLTTMSVCGCRISIAEHEHHRRRPHGPRHPHPRITKPITIDFAFTGNRNGNICFIMPDGEVCKGEYSILPWSEDSAFFDEADYQKYYGKANPADGTQYGRVTAYGEKGTVIQGEYIPSDISMIRGYGLMKDNKGNIYQIEL